MANRDFDRDWQGDYDPDYERWRSSDYDRGRSGEWNRERDFGEWNRGRNWGQGTRPDLPWLRQDYFRNRGYFGGQGGGGYSQGRGYGAPGYRSSYGEDWERRGEYPGSRGYGRDFESEGYRGDFGNRGWGYGSGYGEGFERGGGNFGRGHEEGYGGSYYGNRPWSQEDYGWRGRGFGGSQWQGGFSRGRFSGWGPENYHRSDDRIREDVNDRLTEHGDIDANHINVQVSEAIVTLTGDVDDRYMKRMAEDVAESVPGVKDVHNELKTGHAEHRNQQSRSEGQRQAA